MSHAPEPVDRSHAHAMIPRFAIDESVARVEPLRIGLINDTFVVFAENESSARYVLQRLNPSVFPQPEFVMQNIERVTTHAAARLRACGADDSDRRALRLIAARSGDCYARDDCGACWRMYHYIRGARTLLTVETPAQVHAVGAAFARFSGMLADLPAPRLHETKPGFHDTPARFAALQRAIAENRAGRARQVQPEIAFITQRAALADRLMALHRSGQVPERIAHHDAKLSNVLLDVQTGAAVCVVDLDLVMPGLSLFDFGDMVRSMTSTTAEDHPDSQRVALRFDFFAALTEGYLAAAQDWITSAERTHLLDAGMVITLEQAARFLSDYLDGDLYYRTSHPLHNLHRARTQIALLAELERHGDRLRKLIDDTWSNCRRAT